MSKNDLTVPHTLQGYPAEGFIGVSEASLFLGVSTSLLAKWRRKKLGPVYYRHSLRVQYRLSDLRDFASAYRHLPNGKGIPRHVGRPLANVAGVAIKRSLRRDVA